MYELNAVSGEVDIRRAKFTKPSTKNPFSSSSSAPLSSPTKTESTIKQIPAKEQQQQQTIAQKRPQQQTQQASKPASEPKSEVPPIQKRATVPDTVVPAKQQQPSAATPTSFEDALPTPTVAPPKVQAIPEPSVSPAANGAAAATAMMTDVDLNEEVGGGEQIAAVEINPPPLNDFLNNNDVDISEQDLEVDVPLESESAPQIIQATNNDDVERWDDV
jgi:hypothetical protein